MLDMNKSKKASGIMSVVVAVLTLAPLCCVAADLSTPMEAAKSFGAAMQNGDAAAVKDASINVKPELVDGMCDMMKSSKALHDAAVAKFGQDGEGFGSSAKADINAQLKDAKVDENGDTATITPINGKPVTLQKTGGEWKLDFSKMPGMDAAAAMLPMIGKMSAANKDVADDITAGKYATAPEAKKALNQRMMALMMPAATSQPK